MLGEKTMTDEEFQQWLEALARKHLRPVRDRGWLREEGHYLTHAMEWTSSVARFVSVVNGRPGNKELIEQVAGELRQSGLGHIVRILEEAGVLDALDELPEITFGELRRSAIPDEDVRFLAQAGVRDPETEITIIIHYARRRLGRPNARPSASIQGAQLELNRAADELTKQVSSPDAGEKKSKKKIWSGTGKVLAGAVTAAGNLLLATGTLVAPNPATAYGVIGSCALAVAGICQGIGELRGE